MTDIEELKKAFIVNQEDFQKEKLGEYVKNTLKYAKLDSSGSIQILNPNLTQFEQVAISLIARFVGNKLDESISAEVSVEELTVALNIDDKIVSSRLTDLIKGKVVRRTGKGLYSIVPFYISKFLQDLELKYEKNEIKGAGTITSQVYKSRSTKSKKQNIKKKKTSSKGPKPKVDDDFKKKVLNKIDKSKHIYMYNKRWTIPQKVLATLNLVRQDLQIEGLNSGEIMAILLERFRIPCTWSSISISLKKADQKGFTDSYKMQGHSTGMKYKILQPGEEYIKSEIEKIENAENK